jgi:P-type E1-E2 ATPase
LNDGEHFISAVVGSFFLVASTFWGTQAVDTWQQNLERRRNEYRTRLDVVGTRLTSQGTANVPAHELRPGEEVIVHAGEHIPADGTVSEGEAQVEMWPGAPQASQVTNGSHVVAGAFVQSGRLKLVCSKTGEERAFAPLAEPGEETIATRVQYARVAHVLTRQGAIVSAAVVAWLFWMQGSGVGAVVAGFGATWGALSHPIARALPAIGAERWLFWAAKEGICFSHEDLVDRAGAVSVAAFCARGTVLHGEPEVAEVHPLRGSTEAEILALAAGAESVVHHPVASAVLRATRSRHIDLDSCRSHNSSPGMGVVCISSMGDVLVLGSRELLLRERISIALAEETLRALESRGLTALMLARNQHLIGVIALQDSLRAGAKAAVQVLLDDRVEPVLISGDSRATTEAVAHALAIEHVRPEVAASARAHEVKNLIEGGAAVAVIGSSPRDDAALGAAPVPIVLEGASLSWRDTSHGKERAVSLCGRHVLAAPLALKAAKKIRAFGIRAVVTSLLPAAVATATAASLLVPFYLPIVLSAAGAALASRLTREPAI